MNYRQIVKSSTGSALLQYTITTLPAPIQVSPDSGDPSSASIQILISNNDYYSEDHYQKSILFDEIVLNVPVGEGDNHLTTSMNKLECIVPEGWEVTPNLDNNQFTLKKKDEEIKWGEAYLIELKCDAVNKKTGMFELQFVEKNIAYGEGKGETLKIAYPLGKFPYGFAFTNFYATPAIINNKDETTLFWTGSDDANYTLLYSVWDETNGTNKTITKDVTTTRQFKTQALHTSTVFTLTASVGSSVQHTLQTVVQVGTPEIHASFLDVKTGNRRATKIQSDSESVSTMWVKNSGKNGGYRAATFQSHSLENSTVVIQNLAEEGFRGASVTNKGKDNSALVVENNYVNGWRGAHISNNSNRAAALVVKNRTSGGLGLKVEGNQETIGLIYTNGIVNHQKKGNKKMQAKGLQKEERDITLVSMVHQLTDTVKELEQQNIALLKRIKALEER